MRERRGGGERQCLGDVTPSYAAPEPAPAAAAAADPGGGDGAAGALTAAAAANGWMREVERRCDMCAGSYAALAAAQAEWDASRPASPPPPPPAAAAGKEVVASAGRRRRRGAGVGAWKSQSLGNGIGGQPWAGAGAGAFLEGNLLRGGGGGHAADSRELSRRRPWWRRGRCRGFDSGGSGQRVDAGGGAAVRYVRRKLRRPRRGPGGVGCFPPGLAAATTTGGGGRKGRGRLGGAEAAGRRPSRPPGCLCRGLEAPITGERHWGAAVVLVLGLFWRITYSAPSPRRGRRPRGRSREPSRRGRRKVTRMVTRTIGGVRPTPQREGGGGGG